MPEINRKQRRKLATCTLYMAYFYSLIVSLYFQSYLEHIVLFYSLTNFIY